MRVLAILICLLVVLPAGCTKQSPPPKTAFSNVCVVVEPDLGRIRLPNSTDHKFQAELKVMGSDDFFNVLDVSVDDKQGDREFAFTVMHRIGDKEEGLANIVKYSDLPVKYLEAGKWTVWIRREGRSRQP